MMVGWHVLRPCGVTIHKRGYAMPFGVNPKLSNRKAVGEPDPLDPLERPLNVGRGWAHHHHEGGEKYSKGNSKGWEWALNRVLSPRVLLIRVVI